MEILATLIALAAPFLVTVLTEYAKKLQAIDLSPYRKTVLRFVVVVFSTGAAGGTALLTDQPIPQEVITACVQAFLTYVAATGTYFWAKYRAAASGDHRTLR